MTITVRIEKKNYTFAVYLIKVINLYTLQLYDYVSVSIHIRVHITYFDMLYNIM